MAYGFADMPRRFSQKYRLIRREGYILEIVNICGAVEIMRGTMRILTLNANVVPRGAIFITTSGALGQVYHEPDLPKFI